MRQRILVFLFLFILFASYSAQVAFCDLSTVQSYESISGVTEDEIVAIENLKKSRDSFIYGHLATTEAFMLPDGTYRGFTIRFCELLSKLFEIPFIPSAYQMDSLITEFDNGKIDFNGDYIPYIQNSSKYFKTDIIARDSISVFTSESSKEIKTEYDLSGFTIAFLKGSSLSGLINNSYPDLSYNSVYVDGYNHAAKMLQNGEIDAFITVSVIDPIFDLYEIKSKIMFSLIKPPCSMTTANAELRPIISVVNKYLEAGGTDTLYALHTEVDKEYKIYELNKSFTNQEQAYISELKDQGKKVLVALENDNYPISFYNKTEKMYQGIAPDILNDISQMTGIEFQIASSPETKWIDLMGMLKNGDVSIISELIPTDRRKDEFLWADKPYSTAHYALLSKADYPFLSMQRVEKVRVGTLIESAFEEKYHEWFPFNNNTTRYITNSNAMDALDKSEIDLVMASEYTLLSQSNYLGKPDYKVNILFDEPLEAYFGFHKEDSILRSIISKAQEYVDTVTIEYTWTSRIFDYAKRYADKNARITLIFAVFMFFALILTTVLFIKNKLLTRNLENIVNQRTCELKNQASELRRMSLIADNSPLYISYVNKEGKYNYFNPATHDITGYSYDELSEQGLGIMYDEETKRLIYEEIMPKIFELGKYEFELPIIRKDGKKRFMAFSAFTIPSDDYACGSIAMDITERKQLEKQLVEAKEIAVQNSRLKSSFLSRMSHEMRTPLNAVIGMTRIAQNTDSTERMKDCLKKIDSASTHLLGVINDVLDMSKIEAGKFELSYEEFSIEKMITKITNVFHFRFSEKKLRFSLLIDENVPPTILTDEQRLSQVITNLIGNAVKFTPENGEVLLKIHKLPDKNESCMLEFEVSDTGIGISKEFQQRIFLSYEQEKGNGTKNYDSTGLGLSISKHIVEMMDGRIWVESEQGKGAKFIFTICVKVCEEKAVSVNDAQKEAIEYSSHFKGKRILLVEDMEVNREIVLAMLEETGVIIECAEDGEEALRMFEANNNYDLIFMDVHMPVLNGYEATKKIRSLAVDNSTTIPIIAMTANVFKDDIEECMISGMNGHIGKPLEFDAILQELKKHLS